MLSPDERLPAGYLRRDIALTSILDNFGMSAFTFLSDCCNMTDSPRFCDFKLHFSELHWLMISRQGLKVFSRGLQCAGTHLVLCHHSPLPFPVVSLALCMSAFRGQLFCFISLIRRLEKQEEHCTPWLPSPRVCSLVQLHYV